MNYLILKPVLEFYEQDHGCFCPWDLVVPFFDSCDHRRGRYHIPVSVYAETGG